MHIYKILPKPMWTDAIATGVLNGSPLDLADGYIHFSTAAQVQDTASRHFAGVPDLLLVAVPAHLLGESLKWEPSRGGALFPHLYGALPVGYAEWVKPLPLDPDGTPIVPPL